MPGHGPDEAERRRHTVETGATRGPVDAAARLVLTGDGRAAREPQRHQRPARPHDGAANTTTAARTASANNTNDDDANNTNRTSIRLTSD